jgi:phosphoribosylformylglycinamidine cyclo-ligase
MVAVVAADRAGAIAAQLREAGETVHHLGHVTAGQGVVYRGALA